MIPADSSFVSDPQCLTIFTELPISASISLKPTTDCIDYLQHKKLPADGSQADPLDYTLEESK